MPAPPTRIAAAGVDLSGRCFRTATVVGSPALAAETIIASVTIDRDLSAAFGVLLFGYAAATVGTDGVSVGWKIRKTDASGTILKQSGLKTATAATLIDESIIAVDTSPSLPNQVYVMTLIVTSGSAASTVSAVELAAVVI